MRLDKLVDKIMTGDGENYRPGSEYKPRYLVDIVQTLQELDGVNPMTQDGIKRYKDITGNNPDKESPEEMKYKRKTGYISGTKYISDYFQKHIKKFVKDLSEDTKTQLSFQYCPAKQASNANSSYNRTAEKIRNSKKELDEMKEDPIKYLQNKLKNERKFWRNSIMRFPEEYLQFKQKAILDTTRNAIVEYEKTNKDSFLVETKKHMEKQNEKFREKEEQFIKYRDELQKRNLPAKEFERKLRDKYEKFMRNVDRYQDGLALKKLIRSVATASIVELRKKMGYEPMRPEDIELGKVFGDAYNIDTDVFKGKKYNDKRK